MYSLRCPRVVCGNKTKMSTDKFVAMTNHSSYHYHQSLSKSISRGLFGLLGGMRSFLVYSVLLSWCCFRIADAGRCEVEKWNAEKNETLPAYYHCPGAFPEDYTRCCHTEERKCCPEDRHFYNIDRTVAWTIFGVVTVACIIIAVTCLICCFRKPCPLYPWCRGEDIKHDIPHADKGESAPLTGLPDESSPSKKKKKNKGEYAPLATTNGSPQNHKKVGCDV